VVATIGACINAILPARRVERAGALLFQGCGCRGFSHAHALTLRLVGVDEESAYDAGKFLDSDQHPGSFESWDLGGKANMVSKGRQDDLIH
jgi:hypothetical protein